MEPLLDLPDSVVLGTVALAVDDIFLQIYRSVVFSSLFRPAGKVFSYDFLPLFSLLLFVDLAYIQGFFFYAELDFQTGEWESVDSFWILLIGGAWIQRQDLDQGFLF